MSGGRFKGPEAEENVACNLIPMIDIMFLLLLFFMLGADMTQRELEEVELPKADKVQQDAKVKAANEGTRTTVNVFHVHGKNGTNCPAFDSHQVCRDNDHWQLAIRSNRYTLDTVKDALKIEAEAEPEDDPALAAKKLSKRHVMIRGDALAPYGYIQRVIESCAGVGIYRIEVAAALPEPTG
jgi:biopolymer transport protein ExbD